MPSLGPSLIVWSNNMAAPFMRSLECLYENIELELGVQHIIALIVGCAYEDSILGVAFH